MNPFGIWLEKDNGSTRGTPTKNEEELLNVRPLSSRGLVVVGGVVDSRLNLISSSEVVVVVVVRSTTSTGEVVLILLLLRGKLRLLLVGGSLPRSKSVSSSTTTSFDKANSLLKQILISLEHHRPCLNHLFEGLRSFWVQIVGH